MVRERVASAVETTWLAPLRDAPTAIEGVAAVFAAIVRELDGNRAVRGCPANNLTLELSGAMALAKVEQRSQPLGACLAELRTALAPP